MKVLSFGELLWDIIGGKPYIGGAPFNLACHLAKMGAQSALISMVGSDRLGRKALRIAKKFGLNTEYIASNLNLPTGTVEVFLDRLGHPGYTIHNGVAWDEIILEKELKDNMLKETWDAFCFGTLVQRSKVNRNLLYELLSHLSCREIYYDVNLRQNFYQREWIERSLNFSTITKLNEEEATILSELLFDKIYSKEYFFKTLFYKYNLKLLCLTLGEKGSIFYDGYNFCSIPGVKVKVKDTVGAGDSYGAAFLFSFLSGASARESAEFANQIGAFVASYTGAIPEYSAKLKEKIKILNLSRAK